MANALIAALAIAGASGFGANARTLDVIRGEGRLGLCAHPNSLPFASKTANPPGFQIELGRAIAQQLGVELEPDWVITTYQIRAAKCDIVLDTIAVPESLEETGLKLSKPYYHTAVMLVVRKDSPITSLSSLNDTTKVGVQVGSVSAMLLDRRHVPVSTFGFQEDALDSVAKGEVAAATVTPTAAEYYIAQHPEPPLRLVAMDDNDPGLQWNVAVGMVHPDAALRDAINAALDKLRSDGTISRIYARYGVTLEPPR